MSSKTVAEGLLYSGAAWAGLVINRFAYAESYSTILQNRKRLLTNNASVTIDEIAKTKKRSFKQMQKISLF